MSAPARMMAKLLPPVPLLYLPLVQVPMRDPKLASAEHWDVRELIGKGAFAEVFLALPRGQGSKNAKPCVLKR